MVVLYNYYYELPSDIINIIIKYADILYKELCVNKIQHLYYNFVNKKKIAIELITNIEIKYNKHDVDASPHLLEFIRIYYNVTGYIDITNSYNTNVINYCTKILIGKEYSNLWSEFLIRIDNGILIETKHHKYRLNYILDVINGKQYSNKYLNETINEKIDNYNNNYKNLYILNEKFKCKL